MLIYDSDVLFRKKKDAEVTKDGDDNAADVAIVDEDVTAKDANCDDENEDIPARFSIPLTKDIMKVETNREESDYADLDFLD